MNYNKQLVNNFDSNDIRKKIIFIIIFFVVVVIYYIFVFFGLGCFTSSSCGGFANFSIIYPLLIMSLPISPFIFATLGALIFKSRRILVFIVVLLLCANLSFLLFNNKAAIQDMVVNFLEKSRSDSYINKVNNNYAKEYEDAKSLNNLAQTTVKEETEEVKNLPKKEKSISGDIFVSNVYDLQFIVPKDYFIASNSFGIDDPAKADRFFFRRESINYNGVPTLDVSTNLKLSTGQTLQQLAQSIYNINKEENNVIGELSTINYSGVIAYEFNLKDMYEDTGGGIALDSAGGKVTFIHKNGKVFRFLQTGKDVGLISIFDSLQFIN